jgi:hypothetical protein
MKTRPQGHDCSSEEHHEVTQERQFGLLIFPIMEIERFTSQGEGHGLSEWYLSHRNAYNAGPNTYAKE